MAYNRKQQLELNIHALRLAFSLEEKGKIPNSRQLEILRQYAGFGGLKCILLSLDYPEKWNSSDKELYPLVKDLFDLVREYSPTEEIYESYVESLKASVLTSFYTPMPVVQAIGKSLEEQGIEAKRFLDPSAGLGVFPWVFWNRLGASCMSFEKDLLTGKILSLVQPEGEVHIKGFEEIEGHLEGHFDVIASNIPFGNFAVFDPAFADPKDRVRYEGAETIHTYFFMKSVDLLREGGVVAFITSKGVMDTPGHRPVRRWLMERCDLLSAIRLPNNLFTDNAGTSVGSDLILLQKNSRKEGLSKRESAFVETRQLKNGIHINNTYKGSSRAVHTDLEMGTNAYGQPDFIFYHKGGVQGIADSIHEMLREDLGQYFRSSLYNRYLFPEMEEEPAPLFDSITHYEGVNLFDMLDMSREELDGVKLPEKVRSQANRKPRKRLYKGEFKPWYKNDMIVTDRDQVGFVRENQNKKYEFHPLQVDDDQTIRIKAYMDLRDAYMELFTREEKKRQPFHGLRERLNDSYGRFTEQYGDLNERENFSFIALDGFGNEILSLEHFKDGKKTLSDIFNQPVSFQANTHIQIDSAREALAASLNKFGRVHPDYMGSVCSRHFTELKEELSGFIYYNPLSGEYEVKEKIIAGDVVSKREELENYLKEYPEDKQVDEILTTIEALRRATPEPIPYGDLDFNFGERWMPTHYFERYVSELFGTGVFIVYDSYHDLFGISIESETEQIKTLFSVKCEKRTLKGNHLLPHALLNTVPTISKTILNENGEEKKVSDYDAMATAEKHIDTIRSGFTPWLDKLPQEEKEELTAFYNRKFNSRVIPEYDGSFLTFPGLDLHGLGIQEVRQCQKDAVWMQMLNQGGIVDHEVGLGKTLTICLAAHEMKRLKMIHKPMVLGMKANIDALAATYVKAYPFAKVLFPSEKDFSPKNRNRLFNRIKNDNWDVIFITHDQFMMIPQPLWTIQQVLNGELNEVNENLRVLEKITGVPATKRLLEGLQKSRENLKAKLAKVHYQMEQRRDDMCDVETMGVDYYFIDESHEFKNLRFATRYGWVAGMGNPQGSQKALNLLYAVRTLQFKNKRDLGVTFLSGTTISNSIAELYLLFKYLRPGLLHDQGISTFDGWAAVFARKTSEFEIGVTGEIKRKERLRYFLKVPELACTYNEITHFRTAEQEGIDRPKINEILHQIPLTPEELEFIDRIRRFAESGELTDLGIPGLVNTDNADKAKGLLATSYGKKMTLDMRLIDPERYTDHPSNKISHAARCIAEVYYRFHEQRGTQFVFCDLGVYKPDEWNVYSALKEKLMNQYGVPPREIVFIQECKNQEEKAAVIEGMNRGTVRITLGSTKKMGTGVNAQKRATDGYHLDLTWTPSGIVQRNGRLVRFGNVIAKEFNDNTVNIHFFLKERSTDLFMLTLVKNKAFFIGQIKSGSLKLRRLDEGAMDENGNMPFNEWIAHLQGNPDLLEVAKLEKEIAVLENESQIFRKGVRNAEYQLQSKERKIAERTTILQNMEADWEYVSKHLPVGEDGKRPNPIRLDGLETDDPEEIGEKLARMAEEEYTFGDLKKIGNLLKFDLVMRSTASFTGARPDVIDNRFFVKGALNYSFNSGLMASEPMRAATNFVRSVEVIPSWIETYKKEIAALEKDSEVLKGVTGKTWEKEDTLREMKEKKEKLERRIERDLRQEEQGVTVIKNPEEVKQKAKSIGMKI